MDVPNASVMVVEHAERFGLSQLHQLRGRVGRGPWAVALRAAVSVAVDRRRAGAAEGAGVDERRVRDCGARPRAARPGDFFGTRQSGLPKLRTGDLVRDRDIMEEAHREARRDRRGGRAQRRAAAVRAAAVAAAVRTDRSRVTDESVNPNSEVPTAKTSWPMRHSLGVGRWALGVVVRVIAGQFKGRRLKAPSWDGLRPTSDKLRETLFNILAPRDRRARACWTALPGPARSASKR